jgi:hypothetical protein
MPKKGRRSERILEGDTTYIGIDRLHTGEIEALAPAWRRRYFIQKVNLGSNLLSPSTLPKRIRNSGSTDKYFRGYHIIYVSYQ